MWLNAFSCDSDCLLFVLLKSSCINRYRLVPVFFFLNLWEFFSVCVFIYMCI